MEIARVQYALSRYLRVRLIKIQSQAEFIASREVQLLGHLCDYLIFI